MVAKCDRRPAGAPQTCQRPIGRPLSHFSPAAAAAGASSEEDSQGRQLWLVVVFTTADALLLLVYHGITSRAASRGYFDSALWSRIDTRKAYNSCTEKAS